MLRKSRLPLPLHLPFLIEINIRNYVRSYASKLWLEIVIRDYYSTLVWQDLRRRKIECMISLKKKLSQQRTLTEGDCGDDDDADADADDDPFECFQEANREPKGNSAAADDDDESFKEALCQHAMQPVS